jgi:hypothetical protein
MAGHAGAHVLAGLPLCREPVSSPSCNACRRNSPVQGTSSHGHGRETAWANWLISLYGHPSRRCHTRARAWGRGPDHQATGPMPAVAVPTCCRRQMLLAPSRRGQLGGRGLQHAMWPCSSAAVCKLASRSSTQRPMTRAAITSNSNGNGTDGMAAVSCCPPSLPRG